MDFYDEPLPDGWEAKLHPSGRTVYLNHNDHTTSWDDPRKTLRKVPTLVPRGPTAVPTAPRPRMLSTVAPKPVASPFPRGVPVSVQPRLANPVAAPVRSPIPVLRQPALAPKPAPILRPPAQSATDAYVSAQRVAKPLSSPHISMLRAQAEDPVPPAPQPVARPVLRTAYGVAHPTAPVTSPVLRRPLMASAAPTRQPPMASAVPRAAPPPVPRAVPSPVPLRRAVPTAPVPLRPLAPSRPIQLAHRETPAPSYQDMTGIYEEEYYDVEGQEEMVPEPYPIPAPAPRPARRILKRPRSPEMYDMYEEYAEPHPVIREPPPRYSHVPPAPYAQPRAPPPLQPRAPLLRRPLHPAVPVSYRPPVQVPLAYPMEDIYAEAYDFVEDVEQPAAPSKKKYKKVCKKCNKRGHTSSVCPNAEAIAEAAAAKEAAAAAAAAREAEADADDDILAAETRVHGQRSDFFDSAVEKAIISGLKHEAVRVIIQYLETLTDACTLDGVAVSETVAWEVQYGPALGSLKDFVASRAKYFLLEDDLVSIRSLPKCVLSQMPPLASVYEISHDIQTVLEAARKRRVEQVSKETFAKIMSIASAKQFGAVHEVPLSVQSLYNQLAYDTTKALLYIKVTANALDWHGPLPKGPFEWMMEQIRAVITEAQEDEDPHLHIFNFIHSVFKLVMFIQVQLMDIDVKRPMAQEKRPWDFDAVGQVQEEEEEALEEEPPRRTMKERDIVFLD